MSHGDEDDLSQVRQRAANFSLADLEQLYLRNGFTIRSGNHPVATHTEFPEIRGNLPNHRSFATGYVYGAVKLIRRARIRETEKRHDERSKDTS